MHQHAGCPARARIECRIRDVVSRPWCSIVGHRSLAPQTGRHTLTPQRIQVSCPAVEQDTELPSSSGRSHSDSDLLHALYTSEQPSLVDIQELGSLEHSIHELNRRIKGAGSLPLLCDLIQQEAPNFDYKTASHAIYRLSILCHAYFTQLQSAHLTSREAQQAAWLEYVEPALQTLGQLLIKHMDMCDAWAVSISFWAYGNLQCSDEAVFAALCERGLHIMHEFTALDCASALVGIAKLRVRPRCQREFVDHLLSHTHDMLSSVESWGSQEVTNVLWALSRIGAAGPSRRALLEGLLEMTLWRLSDFKVQELALIVYSCGRMRLRLPLQLVRITNHIAAHLSELKPIDAAHVLWGCAKLDFKPGPELLERLPHVMVDRLSEFKPQEVCNLLYGYGHLRHPHPVLLEGVAKACTPRLHEFSTQDLCLTLWSYGMLRYTPSDPALFDSACRVLLSRSNRLLPLELTMTIKAFARAGYQPSPEFMRQVAQLAMVKLHQFSPGEYAQLLWAYATLGYRDVPLFEAVVAHTIHVLQTWTRRLPKTTVDTIVFACERVGFWPQMLVDTAEMRGLYVKTRLKGNPAEMEQLLPQGAPRGREGQDAVAAAAVAADYAAAAALTAAGGSDEGQQDSSDGSSSSSGLSDSLGAAIVSALLSDPQQQVLAGSASQQAAPVKQQQQQPPQAAASQPDPQASLQQQQQQHVPQQAVQQLGQQVQQQPRRSLFQNRSSSSSSSRKEQQPAVHLQLLRPPRRAPQQQQRLPGVTASPPPAAAVPRPAPEVIVPLAHSSSNGSNGSGNSSSSSSSGLNGHVQSAGVLRSMEQHQQQ